ncbi:uncharacterized protein SCHCODRAFT_02630628 [Schizophyllum commune H4-8]|uniref:uncharacterized protein n=1 Tax=Schizophyllum commune (strain H4-8 / FGSC 9210) TaxID=578458 RepID=UPI00215F8817|nr:uncharacterized protein SCHCODRAFT_02630628 [Schizophyllum commune H4-8]KAI5890009.1 hypothetical protein SCHCODRAFT_02630628 [Schizophyllum commune H4-8]
MFSSQAVSSVWLGFAIPTPKLAPRSLWATWAYYSLPPQGRAQTSLVVIDGTCCTRIYHMYCIVIMQLFLVVFAIPPC